MEGTMSLKKWSIYTYIPFQQTIDYLYIDDKIVKIVKYMIQLVDI